MRTIRNAAYAVGLTDPFPSAPLEVQLPRRCATACQISGDNPGLNFVNRVFFLMHSHPKHGPGRADMRILLIEDDSGTPLSIELMLKSESFNIYTTDLGEEGIDLGKIYDYDIIILDLNLPDMSGFEVLRSLRVSKVKTPVLILTGLAAIEDKVRA